ncbi:hypothetical protein OKJ48_25580 [Streptomyces kunmingensis]|uniref:Tox-REase-2 domain-containing protein n=1 Tax=Streptomyces kunmingensis TaxID=68225 RepID=A0ABU6CGT4_9ACTN|nr:restriction endonuclease fold toxin-2 domain-containing protein [Streptomyces kunmingensis]MEB3963585.1 hypothetical protein [Streptomyces kunmingensis]
MPPDLKVIADNMVKAAMTMVDSVMPGARDTAVALSHELARQKGMAGDDDAGHEFAKVYKPAAATALDKIGFSAYVMGGTGRGLMRNVREFMARESDVASKILGQQVDMTYAMGNPDEDCDERFTDLGQELEEIIGETSGWDQFAPGGQSDRFRGSPEKLRDVADCWRRGGKLMVRFLEDAQACAHTADKAHSGEAANAFHKYFAGFVGFAAPPDNAQQDETLVANLVAACNQLAKACDQYADHVDAAKEKIRQHQTGPHLDNPFKSPMFGGNGYDGGLKDAVLDDPWIRRLGSVAHALDSSEARVKLPPGSDDRPGLPGLPLVPIPIPAPAPFVLASYDGAMPGIMPAAYRPVDPNIPWAAPLAPVPGTTRLLSAGERQDFNTFVNSLSPHTFGGGSKDPTTPENAYQLRTAGYPERKIPLPAGSPKGAIAADGMRPADGYMVDAKYVKNQQGCFRKPSTFDLADKYKANGDKAWSPKDVLVGKDEKELGEYKLAMDSHQQIRGLEIVTNDQDSVAYWQTLMANKGVYGTSRYVP